MSRFDLPYVEVLAPGPQAADWITMRQQPLLPKGERHLLRVSEQAEKEPAAFAAAATELFGPEEARQSIEDWMEELALVNWAHGEPTADWRPVTISAAARPIGFPPRPSFL